MNPLEQLKPCPNPWGVDHGDSQPMQRLTEGLWYRFYCPCCGTVSPIKQTIPQAIEAWNTRPIPTPAVTTGERTWFKIGVDGTKYWLTESGKYDWVGDLSPSQVATMLESAPLSSEAVGKVIKDAFKEGKIRGFRYGCEMSETWPENLQDQKAVTGVMLDQTDGYFIQALALLPPSPREKCGECGGKGEKYFVDNKNRFDLESCPTCQGTGHTKAPSPSEKEKP